jgi:hypothetical protein
MAETRDSKEQAQPRGIAAAAIEGATQGERANVGDPDDAPAKLARPAPGMTKQREPARSGTNQYTGVTGAIRDEQDRADDDADKERRRSGGGNPDAADEPLER